MPILRTLLAAACAASLLSLPAAGQPARGDNQAAPAPPASAVTGPERITRFLSEIKVMPDASMQVTETITVEAHGFAIKHGIIRDFPTRYKDSQGNRVEVGFRLREVRRDGASEPYTLSQAANGVSIRIGSADSTLPAGQHTYTLAYRTTRQLGFFEGYDELYWNVTGNGWELPIDMAAARVELPPGITADSIQTTAYTGSYGTRGTGFIASSADSRAEFATTQPLPPYHGLTIAVQWPAGHVRRPSPSALALLWLRSHLARILSILGVLLILLYFWLAWRRVGIDPPAGFIMPRDTPPDWLSPAALRYILQRGSDSKGFTAALTDLAVHGALRIDEDVLGEYKLSKLAEPAGKLPPDEAELLTALFNGRETLELKQANYLEILEAQQALKSSLSRRIENVYYRRNAPELLKGAGLSLLVLLAVGGAAFSLGNPPAGVLAATALYLVAINVLFALLIPSYTIIGRGVLDGIEGFRLALVGGADEYGEEHPGSRVLTEKYLPYAIALEVHNQWAARFERALRRQAAAGGAAQGGASPPGAAAGSYLPAWFFYDEEIHGPHARQGESFSSFAAHFTSALNRNISAASVPPGTTSGGGTWSGGGSGGSFGGSSGGASSSGSGGGGFSGGGGGGGGGKGW